MSKKICFSVPSYVFDSYFSNLKGNRSEYIIKNFLIGIETEIIPNIQGIKDELRRLKMENEQLREKLRRNAKVDGIVDVDLKKKKAYCKALKDRITEW